MRLLRIDERGELTFTQDLHDNIPPYAILSHTWGDDEDEVHFDDLKQASYKKKSGYTKIRFCAEQAEKDQLKYFWVDTCCIHKANLTELTEAINSMFQWYQNAIKCYVFLSDVPGPDGEEDKKQQKWKSAFRESRWFKRGWTLQELLAPASVEFFSREGTCLGCKSTLEDLIHETTGIQTAALRSAPLSGFSVDERMLWAQRRDTKKKEDKAYCLFGIFDVLIPLLYGEGEEKAFSRLRKEIDGSQEGGLSTAWTTL